LVIGAAIVAAVATGMVVFSDPAVAQPPGGKGGFEKGGFDKKDGPGKRDQTATPGDPVKTLEAELAKLKAAEADLEAKLHHLKTPPVPPAPPAPPAGPPGGGPGFGPPGGFGPGGFGPPGGFGRGGQGVGPGGGGFGRGPGGGGFGFGGNRGFGGPGGPSRGEEAIARMASEMSAAQLKEVIETLVRLHAEKVRAEAPPPRPKDGERSRTETRPSANPQEEILKRLDQLSKELDEIRRAIRK
jgi:hypothetical protein